MKERIPLTTTTTNTPTVSNVRYAGSDLVVDIDGVGTRYKRDKVYGLTGALLRAMVKHHQSDGRVSLLISAFPRPEHAASMPRVPNGRGSALYDGWSYVLAVTKDLNRCKLDCDRWIDISKLRFSLDTVD